MFKKALIAFTLLATPVAAQQVNVSPVSNACVGSASLAGCVLSGTMTGTYTLGGTPTISSPTVTTPSISSPTVTGTMTGPGNLSYQSNGIFAPTDATFYVQGDPFNIRTGHNNTITWSSGNNQNTVVQGYGGTTIGYDATVEGGPATAGHGGSVNLTATPGVGGTFAGGSVILTPGAGVSGGANGTIQLVSLVTGTNADFLCLGSGNVVLIQASACTISSMRFKKDPGPIGGDALARIVALEPIAFTMKDAPNADPNFARRQLGLTAENVAAVDPRMAIYEDDGVTPKSYRQEAVIAALVAAVKELSECRLRVGGSCWIK